jgi:hypothetical protein
MKNLGMLAGFVLGLFLAQGAQAHRFAPSLLKVTEIAAHQYNVVWKTPVQGTSNVPLQPLWPGSCEITSSSHRGARPQPGFRPGHGQPAGRPQLPAGSQRGTN